VVGSCEHSNAVEHFVKGVISWAAVGFSKAPIRVVSLSYKILKCVTCQTRCIHVCFINSAILYYQRRSLAV
jgi:hypothetical protein